MSYILGTWLYEQKASYLSFQTTKYIFEPFLKSDALTR